MEENKTLTSFSKWKPIEIMLAVLFLIAPFYYHSNIGGEGFRIPNNITVWMVASTIIYYSIYLVLRRPSFVLPKYFSYFAAFPVLISLSGFVTGVEQPLVWLCRLLFIWGGLAFFFSLFQHGLKQEHFDRVLFVIVVSALFQVIVGLAQLVLQAETPQWLPRSVNGLPDGMFQQINNQITYQVTAIVIAIYLITRPILINGKQWVRWLCIIFVAGSSLLVSTSGSRIGILSLTLSLLIIIPALWQRFKADRWLSLFVFFALLLGSFSGMIQGESSDKVVDKTIAIQSGYSGSARLGIYGLSFDLIKKQPVFGYGIGSFPRVWQFAKPKFYEEHPDAVLPIQFASHPHNETIFWLFEGGVIALLGLVGLLLGTILTLKQVGWKKGCAYLAMLLPIGLHTQVELPFYVSSIHWFMFLVLLSMFSFQTVVNKTRIMTVSLTKLSNVMLIIIFMMMMASFTHTLRSQWDFVLFYQGKSLDNPFPYALNNPYLSDQARWIDMNTILNSSLQYDDSGNLETQKNIITNVNAYIKWGEQRLVHKPTLKLYNQLARAYLYLGDKVKFCSVIKQAYLLYPSNEQFTKAIVEQCEVT